MEFSIFFAGLICHEGPNEQRGSTRKQKTRSSVLEDSEHTPYITSPSFSEVLKTSVKFKGLENGPALPDSYFLSEQHVPHLEDLTLDPVHLEKRSPALRVHIPGGKFTVANYFEYMAEYHLTGTVIGPSCIAHLTLLLSEPTAREVEVTFNGRTETLPPDSWLLIENASDADPNPPGSHWTKNFRFTNGSDIDIATIKELSGKPCRSSATGSPYLDAVLDSLHSNHDDPDTQSECSNSQWP